MVPPRHSSVPEAYTTLGIEEGSSLDIVKSAYKKLALSTHPDKNPDNADATAQFQKVSEAYNILVKHLDRSSRPAREHTSGGPPRGFGFSPFGGGPSFGDYDDIDDESDDEYYDEDDYDDEEEDMAYYMWMFEEFLRGRARSRFTQSRYHHESRPPPESQEEYQARLRRSREAQVAGEERRAREAAERKVKIEKEREKERREAEKRQKAKKADKKGQAEASRKKAENALRTQQERAQNLRSATFTAARAGDSEKVKKGVWEDNVDAAGGEVKKGSEEFVKAAPADPKETLLHIAVKNGDGELVEWLDSHSADPEERNSQGLTPFHLAVRLGHAQIIQKPFFENYSPKESEYSAIYSAPESTSVLLLAIESYEPEVVWMVLDKGIAGSQDIGNAWTLVSSSKWKDAARKRPGRKVEDEKLDEIRQLLMTFGGFTPPPTPTIGAGGGRSEKQTSSAAGSKPPNISGASPPSKIAGAKKKTKSSSQYIQPASTLQPQLNEASNLQTNHSTDSAVRGRGRGRGRGK